MPDTLHQVPTFLQVNWLSIVFGIITFVGTAYTFVSWLANRTQKRINQHLFKLAELHLDKTLTDEAISKKKDELSNVSNEVFALQRQIRRDIPLEAKKVVLRDRLDESLEFLKRYYDEVVTTKSKLEQLGASTAIPQDLLDAIQAEIQPRFVIKERISNLKTYVSAFTSGAAMAFALLPWPFDRFVGAALFTIAVVPLLMLLKLSASKGRINRQRLDLFLRLLASALGSVLFIVLFFITFMLGSEFYKATWDKVLAYLGSFACLVIFIALSNFFLRLRRQLANKPTAANKRQTGASDKG